MFINPSAERDAKYQTKSKPTKTTDEIIQTKPVGLEKTNHAYCIAFV